MKSRVNNSGVCLLRIAHETVLAAFPWPRFFTAIITLDILIEVGPAALKNCVVVGRQCQIDSPEMIGPREFFRSRRFSLRQSDRLQGADRGQRWKQRTHRN